MSDTFHYTAIHNFILIENKSSLQITQACMCYMCMRGRMCTCPAISILAYESIRMFLYQRSASCTNISLLRGIDIFTAYIRSYAY